MELVVGLLVFLVLLNTKRVWGWVSDWELPSFELPSSKTKRLDKLNRNTVVEIPKPATIDEAFEGFIGNEGAILQVKRMLRYAEQTGEKRLPNLGLFGPKSTGKTELARRISKALDLPTLTLSKSTLNSEESFFAEVSKEIEDFSDGMLIAPPMIIFIDEVHVLPRRIQDSLLTALERDDRCFRSKSGDINTHNITFIMATTDPGKLAEAFQSRLHIFWLDPYSVSQIVEILKMRRRTDDEIDSLTLFVKDDALEFIARAARGVPRKAIELLRQVGVALSLGDIAPTLEDIKRDLRRTMACDAHGLIEVDRRYLRMLQQHNLAGLGLLCAALGMDKDNIEKGIEPWLIQNGWVERTARGRKLSPKGFVFVENYL